MWEHLRPTYADKFRCIGADCGAICCRGWSVLVDKATFTKYQTQPRFQSLWNRNLVILNDASSDSRYGRIEFSADCPLLTDNHLCSIQAEFGEESLSTVCHTYPRNLQTIDGLPEQPLNLSCPEAARLVLLNPELLEPSRGESGHSWYDPVLRGSGQWEHSNQKPRSFIWDLRSFTILLLRDRTYPLWQRLFILGMFSKRFAEILDAKQFVTLPKLLKDYAQILEDGKLRLSLNSIESTVRMQLEAMLEVIHYLQAMPDTNARIRACMEKFEQGIGCSPTEAAGSLYKEARQRYYEPFMKAHPYILENYLVNHVFKANYPFGCNLNNEPISAKTQHLLMCLQFFAIRGLLIGIAGQYKESFGPAHVVELISSFAKAVEHSTTFPERVNQELATADGMARLLKN